MKLAALLQMVLVTIACVLVMAVFSKVLGDWEQDAPVAALSDSAVPQIELNEANLVDELIAWNLPLAIDKIDFGVNVLSLDLAITDSDIEPWQVYDALSQTIVVTFGRTTNVNRLLVRFVAEDPWLHSKYLLLAANVRREGWPEYALYELSEWGNRELNPELKQWFHITETNLWKEMLQ